MDNNRQLHKLKTAVMRYLDVVRRRVSEKRQHASLSADAVSLDGVDANTLNIEATLQLQNHLERQNPHQVTAAQLGGYSKTELDQLLGERLGGTVLPISTYGHSEGVSVLTETNGWTVGITDSVSSFFSGRRYLLGPWSQDLTQLSSSPANKTFYVYLELLDGVAEYRVRTDQIPDTFQVMLIGTIVTGASEVQQFTVDYVVRIDVLRLMVGDGDIVISKRMGV